MAELVGEFPFNSTYSELPLIPQKLAFDVMSISGLAGNLGDRACPYIGSARLEFLLTLPTATGVAVSEVAVLVIAWAAWAVLEIAGKVEHSYLFMRTLGENSGMSRLKTTREGWPDIELGGLRWHPWCFV